VFLSPTLHAQTVTGTVLSYDNTPIIGASVVEAGTTNGTVTDFNGVFTLKLTTTPADLRVSFVGYAPETAHFDGSESTFHFQLEEGADLDEVVVTALGISREKKGLTYAVEEVRADELTTVKDANLINTLAGKTAGVVINHGGGGVGSSVKVTLRGNKSTTNNEPLYVIDGIPMLNNTTTGQQINVFGGGIDGGDGISNINPEDIESLSLLKGASAAALYGSQAANGVILITTKKGKIGKPTINASSSYITEEVTGLPDLQYSYGQSSPGAEFSWGPKVNAPDHVTDFFQTGSNWVNSISISGGTENAQSYFSFANSTAKGILPTNELDRNNFSFNQAVQLFDKKLKLNGMLNYTDQNVKNRPAQGLYFNPLTGLYFFPRGLNFQTYTDDFEVYSQARNFNVQNWIADRDIQQNPYWILNRNLNENDRRRFISSLSAGYQLNSWINVTMRGNLDKAIDHYTDKIYASTQATLSDNNGRYILNNIDDQQTYGDIIVSLNRELSSNLDFNLNVGASHTQNSTYSILADSKNGDLSFANKFGLQYMKNPVASTNLRETLTRLKRNSVFGSAQFGYKNYLYFDVTARNDWSSSLPDQSYFYPSFGLSAVLSEMMNTGGIDYLKARVSYAIVGNDVPAYLANAKESRGNIINGQLSLSTEGPIPGTTLVPEKSKSFEVGFDLRTLKNRLGIDFTYYKSNTENQFIKITAPAGSGFTRYLVNAGNIQNSGIEALIRYKILDGKKVSWESYLTLTKNTNKVISLHPEFDDEDGAFRITDEAVNSYAYVIKKGSSFGDIYGVTFARDTDGRIILDADGKPTKESGLNFLGNPNPDFTLGFNNELTFGRFSFGFLIDGRFGGEVMSVTEALLDEFGVSQRTADARDANSVAINAVSENGTPVTTIDPQTYYTSVGGRQGISEAYIYDATNVRLREVSLGYKVPASIMDDLGFIRGATISVVGRNLFFFSNKAPFDPDVTFSTGVGLQGIDVFSLPSTRSLGFTLSLDF
jgi:TonB-linked SusC/RagA family outer membrane protein